MDPIHKNSSNYERTPRATTEEIVIEGGLRHLRTLDAGSVIQCCALDSKGTLLAVGCANGAIKVYLTKTGDHVYTLANNSGNAAVTDLVFLPRAQETPQVLVAINVSGEIQYWEVSSKSCFSTIKEDRQPLGIDFSPDFTSFAVCGSDSVIDIYDSETKTRITRLQPSIDKSVMDGHMMRVFAVKYHPIDDTVLASGGWDKTIQIWDRRSAHSERLIPGPHICGHSLDFSEHGTQLMAGSWRRDNAVQVFDFAEGSLLETYDEKDHTCQVYSAMYLGKRSKTILYGGNQENMMRLVDCDSKLTLGKVHGFSQGVFAVDGRVAPPGARRYHPDSHRGSRADSTPPLDRSGDSLEFGVVAVCSDRYCYLFSHFVR